MRLLTWNVQWCRGLDGVVDPARIAAEARRFDPDVLCLQEVASGFDDLPGSRGEDQFALLSSLFTGYFACAVQPVNTIGPRGERRFGNLILSRLPVRRVLRHSLPWPPSPDTPSMPRGAVEAVVDAEFGPLRVLSTHLEYASAEHRAAQVGRLRAMHAEACAPRLDGEREGPYLEATLPPSAAYCGDFNFRHDDPLHERIIHAGFVDAWNVARFGEPRQPTFRVHEQLEGKAPLCCDFVFVTADLAPRVKSVEVDGANRASDHQPVIVELR